MNPAVQALITAEVDLPDLKQLVRNPATLLVDLRVDSLARESLAMALEHEFGIELPDAVVSDWICVGDVMRDVAARTGVVLGEIARG